MAEWARRRLEYRRGLADREFELSSGSLLESKLRCPGSDRLVQKDPLTGAPGRLLACGLRLISFSMDLLHLRYSLSAERSAKLPQLNILLHIRTA